MARIYDVLLGGKDNFASDREAAEKLLKALPDAGRSARENRAFVGRVVRYLVGELGIRQFLDIGSGLPTQGNIHEVAQVIDPAVRVAYVDNDIVVVRHGQALIGSSPCTIVIEGDLRRPAEILANEELRRHIDLDKPLAILLTSVLHFVPADDDAQQIVEYLTGILPSGSYLVISHGTKDDVQEQAARQTRDVYNGSNARVSSRGRTEVARLFTGLELIEPGLVALRDWRNETQGVPEVGDHAGENGRVIMLGGVGRKT